MKAEPSDARSYERCLLMGIENLVYELEGELKARMRAEEYLLPAERLSRNQEFLKSLRYIREVAGSFRKAPTG